MHGTSVKISGCTVRLKITEVQEAKLCNMYKNTKLGVELLREQFNVNSNVNLE